MQISSFDSQFIHLATEEQLPHILKKFWSEKKYVLLKIDPSKLIGRLVLETNPGGTTLYYHLYEGTIPLSSIVNIFY